MDDALLVSHFEIPTIFSIGPINVYIINAEPLTLIDTGLQNDKAETALKAGLHSLGYSMKDIQRIFITHGDYDHSGLAVKISESSGASIYVHKMEKLKMDGWNNYISRKADVLRAGGLPDKVFDEVVASTQDRVGIAQPLSEYITLSGGEVFPFEGFDLEVFYTPGHALGHLCFFLRKQGFLFAGDTLLAHVTPNPQLEIDEAAQDGRFKSLKQYMNSLDLLEKLPVNKVFTGHGRPVANIKKRITEIREHHSQRAKRIARALAANAKPMSPYQLALELYKVLDGYNNVLGVSEIWGHLDILQEAGVIEGWTERGGHLFKTNSINIVY